MKRRVIPGRFSAEMEDDFVVFFIGMRVNKILALHKWVPVARAMPPMIRELYQHPELGFISAEILFNTRGATTLQYWKSYEQLEAYARGGFHLEAWKRFNKSIGTDGSVGIFHETYKVTKGQYESIYTNMPPFGLGVAGTLSPSVGRRETATRRLGGMNEPALETPPNPEV
ncbi:hypothetical protein J2Z69_001655 [Paenibacillus shirakamiensis]|uniref:Transcriptional regulator n=1 Tax=Paenibacillus shirakamiensis TaxID=1265935 RepID=A0ABS4JJ34_9BACL|nr:DUF4188 domain-containing protein [Paenibacillus shirakamiensis]MBP2000624.1 hypothetical protein [Paenibacillus shirakamiensis]